MQASGFWLVIVAIAIAISCDDSSSSANPSPDASTDSASDVTIDAEPNADASSESTTTDAAVDAASEPEPSEPVIVAVGYGGRRLRSLDLGLTWIDLIEDDPAGGDDQNLLRATTFQDGLFVAVGWRIWTSTDGASWTERTVSGQQWCGGVAYGGGTFLCVGGCGQGLSSSDGLTWQPASDATDGCTHLRSLAYGAGRFVAFGDGGFAVTTTDTASWTPPQTVGGENVVFRDGQFVANGSGVHYTSLDGLTWTEHAGTANTEAYGHGVYLRGQWKGKIERSTDGTTWDVVYDDGGNHLTSFAFGELQKP